MKGILGIYLPRSLPEIEQEIAVVKTHFSHGTPFPLLKSHSEMRSQEDFPVLKEVAGPPIPCLETSSWAKCRNISQPDI